MPDDMHVAMVLGVQSIVDRYLRGLCGPEPLIDRDSLTDEEPERLKQRFAANAAALQEWWDRDRRGT